MDTDKVDKVWDRFKTQDELAEEYLRLTDIELPSMQQQIIKYYGYKAQLKKLIEELRELADAIIYGHPEAHIKEEIADVLNVIEQVTDFKGWNEEIYSIKFYKTKRQLERISNEKSQKSL